MNKVIRNGEVAVLYSPGYGAGWYSWHHCAEAVFHPKLVELVEADKRDSITEELMKSIIPDFDEYIGGAAKLEIEWIPVGTKFKISEYDGNESIQCLENIEFLEA